MSCQDILEKESQEAVILWEGAVLAITPLIHWPIHQLSTFCGKLTVGVRRYLSPSKGYRPEKQLW